MQNIMLFNVCFVFCFIQGLTGLRARDLIFFTTDLQTVIYYSTIHALELIYFDSNTQ